MRQRDVRHVTGRHPGRVLALSAFVALTAACGSSEESSAEAPPLDVRTEAVRLIERAETFEAGGVVQARTTAVVASRILAPVRAVHVAPGDRVRAGQPLVELDGRDLAAGAARASAAVESARGRIDVAGAEHAAAEATLALARASHQRIAVLYERGSATAQERDRVVAELKAAEARVAAASAARDAAEAALTAEREASGAAGVIASFATVVAPFTGVVTEKLVEPGNMVSPGTPLVRLEEAGGSRLEVRVDEARVAAIEPGDPVEVELAGRRLAGKVAELGRAVDADARAFLVKIALPPDDAARSGTFGRALFAGPARAVLAVPSEAAVRRGQMTTVFVVEGERARLRLVRTGQEADGLVDVVSGLSRDERVILDPPRELVDGRRVRLVGGAR